MPAKSVLAIEPSCILAEVIELLFTVQLAPLLATVMSPLSPSVTPLPPPPDAERTPLPSIDKLEPTLIAPKTEADAVGNVEPELSRGGAESTQ